MVAPGRPFLFLILLLSASLTGCLSPKAADCWNIPFPGAGYEVEWDWWFSGQAEPMKVEWSVRGVEDVQRGDGHPSRALAIDWPDGIAYFSLASGDAVGFKFPVMGRHFNINGMESLPMLFGRCLTHGEEFSIPYLDGIMRIEAKVIADAPALIVEFVFTYTQGDPRYSYDSYTKGGRYTWHSRDLPFPDQIEFFKMSGCPAVCIKVSPESLTYGLNNTGQQGPLLEPFEVALEPPLKVHRPLSGITCWDRPLRHADFRQVPAQVAFVQYLENMSTDQSLAEYLVAHPKACAAMVTYEIVTEPSSTAYVWTTIFADETDQNYRKQWVVRCYEEAHLALIYGECSEHHAYFIHRSPGEEPGPSVNTSALESDLGVATAVENLQRLNDQPFTRFEWRAHAKAMRVSKGLNPVPGAEPGAGFTFDYGILEGGVNYYSSQGVRPHGTNWESDNVDVWSSGWVSRGSIEWFESRG